MKEAIAARAAAIAELIDTLWNVNVSPFNWFSFSFTELIDTLWNVNSAALFRASFAKSN